MKIQQNAAGTWDVMREDGSVAATVPTNADAWRWIDRNEVHPQHMTRAQAERRGAWELPK